MNSPLRFCMITTFYPPYHFGGDGMFIYRLSNALASRGHSVDVIHCLDSFYSLQSAEPKAHYSNHPNITVHRLKSRAGILSPLLTQQLGAPGLKGRNIRRILERGRFDVTHFHNISLIGGPKLLEYGSGIKLYTMHEYWLVCQTHVLFKFDGKACVKPSCLACSIAHKRPPQIWRYTGAVERAVKNIHAFIAPSRFVADMHRSMGLNVPTAHIPLFVPNPPELTSRSETLPDVIDSGRPYFLMVGRIEKLKGFQNVIPIFKKYAKAELLIVGAGTYESELRALAEGAPNIKFLGSLPYADLLALYSRATAVIVPSLCYETFGQVVVEAFSVKTPVIVRDTGALRELVTASGGGFLYKDDSGLLTSVELLLSKPELRDQCGARGNAAYLKYWTEERHLEAYLELIEGLRAGGTCGEVIAGDRAAGEGKAAAHSELISIRGLNRG